MRPRDQTTSNEVISLHKHTPTQQDEVWQAKSYCSSVEKEKTKEPKQEWYQQGDLRTWMLENNESPSFSR